MLRCGSDAVSLSEQSEFVDLFTIVPDSCPAGLYELQLGEAAVQAIPRIVEIRGAPLLP